jgi:hypothetical protein
MIAHNVYFTLIDNIGLDKTQVFPNVGAGSPRPYVFGPQRR